MVLELLFRKGGPNLPIAENLFALVGSFGDLVAEVWIVDLIECGSQETTGGSALEAYTNL